MCRRNQLWGSMLIAFGAGVLVGQWIESGLLGCLLAFGFIVVGSGILRRK